MSDIGYIRKTRGYITASKLKAFILAPKFYDLKYNKEIVPPEMEEDSRSLFLGTAFHYIMEHGTEAFLKKYEIGDGYLKADLTEMIIARAKKEDILNPAEMESLEKWTKSTKTSLLDLRVKWYGEDFIATTEGKLYLTPAEGRDLLGMYQASIQQPKWDLGSEYIKEQRIEAKYKNLNLSFQPDRLLFYKADENGEVVERYTMDQINEMLLPLSREEQKALIEKENIRGMIRDFKTTGNMEKLLAEFKYDGDSKYSYILSQSYYYTLIYVIYSIKCTTKLDVVEKKYPYFTTVIDIPESILNSRLSRSIVPNLDRLAIAMETDEWAEPTREEILENRDLKMYAPFFQTFVQEEDVFIDLDMQ